MRIVHTSDWHAGRLWRRVDRLDELVAALDSMARFVERERIDLLLVTGDVFDSGAPSGQAERAVFQLLKRIGKAGVPSVVIAGNHDNPARMEAWGGLAELVDVRVVARPTPPDRGGVIEIGTRAGETAIVAALPFASVGQLVSASQLAGDETEARQSYSEQLRRMVALLCARFRPDAVNVLMAHTHLEGAQLARSEREVHCAEQWAAKPQALPDGAHYVALGHIHRPQTIDAAPTPTRYAGSPLQLDFGEAGEEKSFVLVEAIPGRPAQIKTVPYEGGRALRKVSANLEELEGLAPSLGDAWLHVTVRVPRHDPELHAKVQRVLPNAVKVQEELIGVAASEPPLSTTAAVHTPVDRYGVFVREERGCDPDGALLEAFEKLRVDCASEDG